MVVIDKNGDVRLDSTDLIINKDLTKDRFMDSSLYDRVYQETTYENQYSNYSLSPQDLDKDKLAITLYFNPDGRIGMTHLEILLNGVVSSWKDWSEKAELARNTLHDQWLKSMLGRRPPYKYKWGKISSQYDERSGGSGIHILYNQPIKGEST